MFGWNTGKLTPWASIGFMDASTFFYVGDDGVVTNNLHPYAGPVASLGADLRLGHAVGGLELYAAPGGHSAPNPANVSTDDPAFDTLDGFGHYGHLYTARARLAWEL